MNGYVSKLKLELSDTWHADEMLVKYSWRLALPLECDRWDTRFLLASVISGGRRVKDARRAFRVAKATGKKKPKYIVIDGLQAYHKAFNKEFYDHHRSIKHIRNVGFKDKTNNNNLIERLHGTVREKERR